MFTPYSRTFEAVNGPLAVLFGPNWKMLNSPHADPVSSRTVAHDMIDHEPNSDPDLENEIRATGASFTIRPAEYHDSFMLSLPHALASLIIEARAKGDRWSMPDEPLEPTVPADIERYFAIAVSALSPEDRSKTLAWLRIGYAAAVKRYSGLTGVADVHIAITNQIDRLTAAYDIVPSKRRITVEVFADADNVLRSRVAWASKEATA